MGNDGHPSDRTQSCVKISLTIAPASHADDQVTGLLSNLAFDVATMVGCSSATAAKANSLCLDETEGTIQQNLFASGELKIDLAIIGDGVLVHGAVRKTAVDTSCTEAWFPPDVAGTEVQQDEPGRDMGRDASKTIRRKKTDIVRGGLGLQRLTAESKEKLGPEPGGGGGEFGNDGGSSAPAAVVVPLRKGPP